MDNYVFYKIECLDNSVDFRYVGSTKNLKKRTISHKHYCNNENNKVYNSKIYKTIRANGGWCNFRVVEIGAKEQINKRQAEQVEEDYRIALEASMNSQRCYTTDEQKKEYNDEYRKEWTENNKEKIAEQHREYYKNNKDKIKEWRENNKDKLKEYYENNKKKGSCECGCKVNYWDIAKHRRTKKHNNLIKLNNTN